MKEKILKILSVIGICLIVFCASAGSAADGAHTSVGPESEVSTTPAPVTVTRTGRPEWLRAAFSANAASPSPQSAANPAAFRDNLSAAEDEDAYEYSEEEKAYIARVVYAEARGETFEGQVAVAAVVLNRFESERFGKTVKKVVFARHQFAVSKRYNDESMAAVEAAIERRDEFPEDMYYFRVSKKKRWRNFEYYDRIGNHSFYCAK